MDNILKFPQTTILDKVVPKNAFYQFMGVNTSIKQHFVNDVDRIIWLYKLAPSTLHVEDGQTVHEITFFVVSLKSQQCPKDLFLFIDENMPRHIVFLLSYADRYQFNINYKLWIDPNKGMFRIVESYVSPWISQEELQLSIYGLSMDQIYTHFVGQISGIGNHSTSDLQKIIELKKQVAQKDKQCEALQKKIRKEVQLNRKMQLNGQARQLRQEIEALKAQINQLEINN